MHERNGTDTAIRKRISYKRRMAPNAAHHSFIHVGLDQEGTAVENIPSQDHTISPRSIFPSPCASTVPRNVRSRRTLPLYWLQLDSGIGHRFRALRPVPATWHPSEGSSCVLLPALLSHLLPHELRRVLSIPNGCEPCRLSTLRSVEGGYRKDRRDIATAVDTPV